MRALFGIVATLLAVAAFAAVAQETTSPVYQLDIVSPLEDAIVFEDNGDVQIQATVVPDLADGDRVEFLLDGHPVGPPSTILEVPLYGIVRGPHLIQARIIDATGNVGSISPSKNFHVWQESLLWRAPAPAQTDPEIK